MDDAPERIRDADDPSTTDDQRDDSDATIMRWVPLVVPLLALLPLLTVYFIDWGVLVGTHR